MSVGRNEFRIEKWKPNSNAQAAEPEIIRRSPDGRYIQYNEILGRGAFKIVYKGFDEVDGIEIAWNQVEIEDVLQKPEHLERLYSEVHLLRSLKHENIIRSYAWWVDDENKTINMITELFTSGSLRQYRKKHKCVDIKAIKNWAKQILQGLVYLHTHNPPIIHRDLKCDNIFVNGNHGEVKIGDLGLATIMQQPTARSVIGTPEFMAPELYEEDYNELVDIYSFGMCMLELVTCEYPYSECKNQAQIYKKVTSGIKPVALGKLQDHEMRQFVEKCFVPASERLSAAELLRDPFLVSEHPMSYSCVYPQLSEFTSNSVNSLKSQHSFMDLDPSHQMLSGSSCAESMVETSMPILELCRHNERNDFTLKVEKYDGNSFSFILRIVDLSGRVRNVDFPFYINEDTVLSIAEEMVVHLDLWQDDVAIIAELIDSMISQFVRSWEALSGSLNGTKRIFGGSATSHNKKFPESDACNHYMYGVHDQEPHQRAIYSELTVSKNNGVTDLIGASARCVDALMSPDAMNKMDLQLAKMSTGQYSAIESVKNSGASFAGTWTTASSEMNLSFSSVSLTDKENEVNDDLKVELEAIDMLYRRCCHQLVEMREAAIQNAKKKWIMKKISVL